MSTSSRPIPLYNRPCLASDSSRQQTSFYLAGSSRPGYLTVDYFNSFNSPLTNDPVANQPDPHAWDPNIDKLCFIRPNNQTTNPSVLVIQFGSQTSFIAIAQTNNIVSNATPFANVDFLNAKLFAWSGNFPDANVFTTVTNQTVASKANAWEGLRLDYSGLANSLIDNNLVNTPIDSSGALLAVGTYGTNSGTLSPGHTIVFDKNGGGQIFSTTSDLRANLTNEIRVILLDTPTNVGMNGIKLTASAIPVTMGRTAYILDQANNGSTLLYSIVPSESNMLNPVYVMNSSLQFGNILAASALYNGILTYSSNRSVASFNFFDVTTNTWSGNNLVSAPVVDPPKSSTPIAAIVGGVVGALLVIALTIFFFVRSRRRRSQSVKKPTDGADLAHLSPDTNEPNGAANQAYAPYAPRYFQYEEQGHVQHNQQQYQHPPSFIPPPPTSFPQAENDESLSYKVDTSVNGPTSPYTSPTSPYVSPTSYRDSISQAQGSPESVFSKAQRSSMGHAPQYTPSGSVVVSDARSPQTMPSTSPAL